MKTKFQVPLYGSRVYLAVGKDLVSAGQQLRNIFSPDELPDAEDSETAYGMMCPNGRGDFALVLTRESAKDVNVVAHEIFHLTLRILEYAGAKVESPDHEEPGAYLNGYLSEIIFGHLFG